MTDNTDLPGVDEILDATLHDLNRALESCGRPLQGWGR